MVDLTPAPRAGPLPPERYYNRKKKIVCRTLPLLQRHLCGIINFHKKE
jgi:hypothetical protein